MPHPPTKFGLWPANSLLKKEKEKEKRKKEEEKKKTSQGTPIL